MFKNLFKRKTVLIVVQNVPDTSVPFYIGHSVKLVHMCSHQKSDKTYYMESLTQNIEEQINLLERKKKELNSIIHKINKDIEALQSL